MGRDGIRHDQPSPSAILLRDWALLKALRALLVFAFLAGAFCFSITPFIESLFGERSLLSVLPAALVIIGSFLGGALSRRASDQKIELGLIPLGAFGVAFFSFLLGRTYGASSSTFVYIVLTGVSAGLYVAPLMGFIRYRSLAAVRSSMTVIAISSMAIVFLVGGAGAWISGVFWHLASQQVILASSALVAIFTIVSTLLFPYPLIRFCVWVMTHTFYRLRVVNNGVIPSSGGALIVANHLSLIDVLFITVSTSRRVRFVTDRRFYNNPVIGPLCRVVGAFPISRRDSIKEIGRTLESVRRAIKNGEIVCMFPEGGLSRTGNTLRFGRGVEHIMKGLSDPIIPAYLDRVWGSLWSLSIEKNLLRQSKEFPRPITVVFGDPLPSSVKAFEIRQKVVELGAGAFHYRFEQKMTLPELFFNEMRRSPFSPCVADSTGKSLNRLKTFVASFALARIFRGMFKDEVFIGVFLPPSVGAAVVNLALAIAGKVAVNLNYTASREALALSVKECGMKHCVTAQLVLDKLQIASPADPVFIEKLLPEITTGKRFFALLIAALFPKRIAHRIIFGSWKNLDNNQLATVVFTSGSTGIPKGVMLTHANIAAEIEGLCQIFHITPQDGMMGVLPFFHSFGYTATLWFPLIGGMGAAYHVNPLDAQVVGEMVRKHRSTLLIATPTFLSSYTRRCEKEDLASLVYVVVGAEKLKSSIASAFEEKFGIAPLEGYGCTELSPAVSVNLPDHRAQDVLQKAQKRGTIGLPLPGIAVRVVHPETGEALEPYQEGMLLVKGANVMKGYLNQPQMTAEVITDGWYRTGDIAFVDEDGFITITDRLSRFSKVAGEMVPHLRVEEAIHSVLGVGEQVCVVASAPDEKRGEKLVVLHTIDIDLDELLSGLKEEGLPNLWIPEKGMFFRIEAIPVLGSGKIDLAAVKRLALEKTAH